MILNFQWLRNRRRWNMTGNKIAIIGTVGIPANYGGFETLAENLVRYHDSSLMKDAISVYCSSKHYPSKAPTYLSARLKYVPFNANGIESIPYDIFSLLSAVGQRNDVILLLGVSGAIALPLVRLISRARIVTNIDGIEWRRQKWRGLAKHFLRFSERLAVRFSDDVITDNGAIDEYVTRRYNVKSHVIAYGGDNAVDVEALSVSELILPISYAFSVCRIEPENNVGLILEAFLQFGSQSLVMVGNWGNSEYGRTLRKKYASCSNLFLLDPIYSLGKLKTLRSQAMLYVHGHSAGGTNPSLVEAMHFGLPILAFDCVFNRNTTENRAIYFTTSEELVNLLRKASSLELKKIGSDMLEVAQRRFRWSEISKQYFSLLGAS